MQKFKLKIHCSEDREKYNLDDHDQIDALTYNLNVSAEFLPNLSYPLTGREIITIPHPIIAVSFF